MSPSFTQKGRWTPLGIFAVIIGFVVWWPLGLAAIGYILWGGSIDGLLDEATLKFRAMFGAKSAPAYGSAASESFDVYRNATLSRLEAEQVRRAGELRRLREAPDRAAFDRILSEMSGT